MSRSPRNASLAAAAGVAVLVAAGWAQAQPPQARNGNHNSSVRGLPKLACAPGDTRPVCQARQLAIKPALPVAAQPLLREDMPGKRFIPPKIVAFLADRRIEPLSRAFLQRMSGKPTEDWTLAELELVTSLVPALTEMRIPTAVLSDFYDFLGLDPTNLFIPQLGVNWQQRATAQDAHNLYAVERGACFSMLGIGGVVDRDGLTVGQIQACRTGEE